MRLKARMSSRDCIERDPDVVVVDVATLRVMRRILMAPLL